MMLGNLSISQIESRSGIIFNEEAKKFLKITHSSAADLSEGEWHCFDLPYCLLINEDSLPEFKEKVFPFLEQGNPIQISTYESEHSRNIRLRKESELRLAENEDIHFGNLMMLIRHFNLLQSNNKINKYDRLSVELLGPNHYKFERISEFKNADKNLVKYPVEIKTSKSGIRILNKYSQKTPIKNINLTLNNILYEMLIAYGDYEKTELIRNTKLNFKK